MKTYFNFKSLFNSDTPCDNQPVSARDMLLADIRKTQISLETAYSGFDNATDPDLIDCYIYEVNSALKRYRFLLQQAQSMQLCECFENSHENIPLSEHKLVSQLSPIPGSLSLNHN